MPAEPSLPHTWRPFGARVAGTLLGLMLLAVVLAVWIAWGADVRSRFTPFQKATLVGFGLVVLACLLALMRSRVTAHQGGVIVVNGYRTRELAWTQVVAVNLRRGAPWAGLDLSDGTSISVLAIQGSDGQRAISAVRELRALVAANSQTERND
jgi:hypothetical protein